MFLMFAQCSINVRLVFVERLNVRQKCDCWSSRCEKKSSLHKYYSYEQIQTVLKQNRTNISKTRDLLSWPYENSGIYNLDRRFDSGNGSYLAQAFTDGDHPSTSKEALLWTWWRPLVSMILDGPISQTICNKTWPWRSANQSFEFFRPEYPSLTDLEL